MNSYFNFENTYTNLPKCFFTEQEINEVYLPDLVIFNDKLAKSHDINIPLNNKNETAKILSGNFNDRNMNTFAQAYAGHQFGHFTMLGDGRAVLLGEHLVNKNQRFDIQFKGSGRTSFSRGGDGRAALGPMLREYIISEAINALKIPTTRSLAVVKTGEKVVRENLLNGAILTRVASSHIRVGTFQYIAATQNTEDLNTLVDYTIDRHYPEIKSSKNKALDLLSLVMERQCQLVINWMRVGFIHGVMNTDNMAISGETIDYGPCAFMDQYDPKTVFSSIDKFGRYAFSNQPPITKWNLARFAECLIPLIDKDEDAAIKIATGLIDNFQNIYEQKWLNMMRDKLGLFGEDKNDQTLINKLLEWMKNNNADYTNTFCHLMYGEFDDEIYKNDDFKGWTNEWQKRIKLNNSFDKHLELMKKTNPLVIPRNQKVEEALADADKGNLETMNKLLKVLSNPYSDQENIIEFQKPAPIGDKKYQTFCGT